MLDLLREQGRVSRGRCVWVRRARIEMPVRQARNRVWRPVRILNWELGTLTEKPESVSAIATQKRTCPALAGRVRQPVIQEDRMSPAQRYVGLDVHKYYLMATAVDAELNKVYGPRRVELADLEA